MIRFGTTRKAPTEDEAGGKNRWWWWPPNVGTDGIWMDFLEQSLLDGNCLVKKLNVYKYREWTFLY